MLFRCSSQNRFFLLLLCQDKKLKRSHFQNGFQVMVFGMEWVCHFNIDISFKKEGKTLSIASYTIMVIPHQSMTNI